MDNTRFIVTEVLRISSDEERKAYIQEKMDAHIRQQLEREDLICYNKDCRNALLQNGGRWRQC
jgi:hypothetical protein